METRRRKKASHEFTADGARWGGYRGLGAPAGERRYPMMSIQNVARHCSRALETLGGMFAAIIDILGWRGIS